MLLYRLGRSLQVLALIDAAFALFFANSLFKGMEAQLQILILAGALFYAGRFFQKKGELALHAEGLIPPEPENGSETSTGTGPSGGTGPERP